MTNGPLLSPNERASFTFPGESPSILSARLKYSSLLTLAPDPLDPPDERAWPCEACDAQGCDACGFTGWITEEDLKEANEPDRSGE